MNKGAAIGLAAAALAAVALRSSSSKTPATPPAPPPGKKPGKWGSVESLGGYGGRPMQPRCQGPRLPTRPTVPGPPARLPCGPLRCQPPQGQPPPFAFPGRSIVEALVERDLQDSPVEREASVLMWARAGNLTMRWASLELGGGLVVQVTADMVQLGGVRLCASMVSAQNLADLFGCLIPTPGIVQAFALAATIELPRRPAGHCLPAPSETWCNPGGAIEPWLEHQDRVQQSLEQADPTGALRTAGGIVDTSGKDYVLGDYVVRNPGNCSIFGYFQDGVPQQSPESGEGGGHHLAYFDYSHRIMLVDRRATLNGQPIDLAWVYVNRPELVSRGFRPSPAFPVRHPAVPVLPRL